MSTQLSGQACTTGVFPKNTFTRIMHTYLYIPLFFLQSMPSFVDLLQCNLLQAMPGIRQT